MSRSRPPAPGPRRLEAGEPAADPPVMQEGLFDARRRLLVPGARCDRCGDSAAEVKIIAGAWSRRCTECWKSRR